MQRVPVPSDYDRIIPALLANPEFAEADEYRILIGNAEKFPGVVAAGYAKFVGRKLHEGAPNGELAELMQPLNSFATWHDSKVDEMLKDEVFERLENDETLDDLKVLMNEDLLFLLGSWS